MASKTLTNTAITALDEGKTVWDSVVRGLHVRALKNGKAYYLFYRTKEGVSRRPKLGDTKILELAKARELARSMLAVVAGGGDPVADRTRGREAMTVRELFTRAFKEHWSRRKWKGDVWRLYHAHVDAGLGNRRVRDVAYEDVAGLHAALSATPGEANRTLAVISKMFNLSERYGERVLGSNPCRHVSRYPELARSRFAKPEELAAIGKALDALWATQPASVGFIALLIYTGMRTGEVASARREWIERLPKGAILHLPDAKAGARDVFLSTQALEVIDRLAAKDGTLTGIQYPRKTWDRVREAAGCKDLRLHDLRRTWASVSLAGGASLSLIGELLGHKTAQTTKIYARLMQDPAHQLAKATGDRMSNLLASSASQTQ